MSLTNENNMSMANSPTPNLFAKLAGFQTIIPQFDGTSAVTPKYFTENVEHITSVASCSNDEKLLIMKSRIRGEALSQMINSPDLSQEQNYDNFKEKFLAYFGDKTSLATRQQQYANCKMLPEEPVKFFASRVTTATHNFFGNLDLTNKDVSALFEQSNYRNFLMVYCQTIKKRR